MAEGRWDTLADLQQARGEAVERNQRARERRVTTRPPGQMELLRRAADRVRRILGDYRFHTDTELLEEAAAILGPQYRHLRFRAVNSVVMLRNSPSPDYEMTPHRDEFAWQKKRG